jgi:hypothetical protein
MFHEANRDEKEVCRLNTPIAGTRFWEEGSVEQSLRFQAKREVV